MSDARLAADITGSEPYRRAFVLAGNAQATATLKLAPINDLGSIPRLYVTTGTLTLAQSRGGILTSSSSGNTVLTLPLLSTLGYTRDASNPVEPAYVFQ